MSGSEILIALLVGWGLFLLGRGIGYWEGLRDTRIHVYKQATRCGVVWLGTSRYEISQIETWGPESSSTQVKS